MNQLDRQCEKFIGGPTPSYQERVHVTLEPRCQIFLNQKALALMGKPLAVYLYYNREKDMIVIEPTACLTANNAFPLKPAGGQTKGRHIRANPFCRHFNIRVEQTVRFLSPDVDAAGRMYLKLRETVNVPPAKRRSKEQRQAG